MASRGKKIPLSLKHDVRDISNEIRHAQGGLRILKAVRRSPQRLPDAAGILIDILEDQRKVVALMTAVGTEEFGEMSRSLWGAPDACISKSGVTIAEIARNFSRSLNSLSDEETEKMFPKILNAEGLASLLRQKLLESHLIESVDVIVTDELVADAAAGSHYVKIRKSAKFRSKMSTYFFTTKFSRIS